MGTVKGNLEEAKELVVELEQKLKGLRDTDPEDLAAMVRQALDRALTLLG